MSSPAPSYRKKPPKFIAGALCLDFVNTVTWRGDPQDRGERLRSHAELRHWALRAGILDQARARRLGAAAERRPDAAAAVVADAIEFREAFARLLRRGRGAAADLAIVNARLAAAPPRVAIHLHDASFGWGDGSDAGLDSPLHPVLWSAADLLTSGQLTRVRHCGDLRCSWWFLDTSPTGRRRWCSMQECGNRAKVRRHYQAGRTQGRKAANASPRSGA